MPHNLKIFPNYFEDVISGRKTFEVRYAGDRDFFEGDKILLKEFDGNNQDYTGRQLLIEITYISKYMQKPDYVVFSFKPIIAIGNKLEASISGRERL